MRSIIAFGRDWYADASDELRRADPLLMGAAFAYNSLFAIVPLALAFVSALTLFDRTSEVLENTYEIMNEALPPEIASFLVQVLSDSVAAVEDNSGFIIVVTVLIALWSGSRAVYTIQKALRLVEESDVEVGYVQMRSTGIAVTLGAGVGIVLAYVVILLGGRFWELVGTWVPAVSQGLASVFLLVVAFAWVFALLFAVYRWGAPRPIRRPAATALLVTAIVSLGTWVAINLVPSGAAAAVAVFGTIGIILLWLYAVGVVVVGAPIAIGSLLQVLESDQDR